MSQGRLAAYAAGNKVYGGGRSNPTSGTVDPTGYVERGMNNKESDRRSGLAAAAGRRLGNNTGMAANGQEVPDPSLAPEGADKPFNPITLPDGRMVFANSRGHYEWIPTDMGMM